MTAHGIAIGLLTLCVAATGACGKKAGSGGGGGSPFAAFAGDDKATLAKLQGAWLVKGGEMGQHQAWNVHGDKVTTSDGSIDKEKSIEIVTPCSLEVVDKDANGMRTASTFSYGFDKAGVPHVTAGAIGVRKGEDMMACAWKPVILAGGKCMRYVRDMTADGHNKYAAEPATCTRKKDGDKELLEIQTDRGSEWPDRLIIDGDVLMSEQAQDEALIKATDFADAKVKLAELKK